MFDILQNLGPINLVAIGIVWWNLRQLTKEKIGEVNKSIEKVSKDIEKVDEKVTDIDRRFCRIEGAFSSREFCGLKNQSEVKKAE